VTAQVFLELGDDEMVIPMAKAALVRQDKQGILAVLGHDGGVTDPAASGEAMLHAVKLTGDQRFSNRKYIPCR
jgi:unsaturated rhamnogalacturonyl hydrolase